MLCIARLVAVTLLVSVHSSCVTLQPAISVRTAGSLRSRVRFCFADLMHEHPPPFTVTDVTVYEKVGEYESLEVWSAQGKATVHCVAYGAKYAGLKDSQRPRALQIGHKYKVMVYTGTGAKTFDIVSFQIDQNGDVVSIPNWW